MTRRKVPPNRIKSLYAGYEDKRYRLVTESGRPIMMFARFSKGGEKWIIPGAQRWKQVMKHAVWREFSVDV